MYRRLAPCENPRYSIIDLQKAYAEGRAEAIAQERERLRVAVEGLPTYEALSPLVYREFEPHSGKGSSLDRRAVLALLSPDAGAATGGEE